MDFPFTFTVECKICAVMGTYGVCKFGTKKLDSSGRSNPDSFSSAPVEVRCHFCKNRRYPKVTATQGFQSAEFGFAAIAPKFLPVITPRYTVKRGVDHHRCLYLISTLGTSKGRFPFFSGLMRDFPRSFSSMVPISTSSVRSILRISFRC